MSEVSGKTHHVDSNILIYAYDKSEKRKHKKALKLLEDCWLGKKKFSLSVQNLNEFFIISTEKISHPMEKEEVKDAVNEIIEFRGWGIFEITPEDIQTAMNISIENKVKYWDALVASVMKRHGIANIYTEDVKHFNKIPGIHAVNPLK